MTDGKRKRPASRHLAHHELELWRHVVRHVKPMPGKALDALAVAPTDSGSRPLVTIPENTPSPRKAPSVRVKPLAPLEGGMLRRLSRGRSDPEAKLDLHGMRQAEAHIRLRSFLANAYADGLRVALVVTGKGSSAGPAHFQEERGVLRRMLPHWLSAPELRHFVLGFTEASRRHGGEGAFYVRLRSPRHSHRRQEP